MSALTAIQKLVSNEEWSLRQDLAAAFRLLDKYGMSDLTNGSIVGRLPGTDWFLTHPHGLYFHEIKASDLIKADVNGDPLDTNTPTNFAVCKPAAAIFKERPEVNSVIHAHGIGIMGDPRTNSSALREAKLLKASSKSANPCRTLGG